MSEKITLTKKIAKQGNNLIIIIPNYLKGFVNAGDIIKVEIQKIEFDKSK